MSDTGQPHTILTIDDETSGRKLMKLLLEREGYRVLTAANGEEGLVLAKGEQPKTGTQEPGRHTSEPSGGPTTLKDMVTENHDYRGEW